jgi:hypothetical protein
VVVTPHAFNMTLSHTLPPRALEPPLAALWWARKTDWDKAHRIVMDEASPDAAEGDLVNAGYWYRQARKPAASGALDAEWAAIVETLLNACAQRTK